MSIARSRGSDIPLLDRGVTLRRIFPGAGNLWFEMLQPYVMRDVLTRLGQRCEATICDRLYEQAADDSRFDWSSRDRQFRRVRCSLIQIVILTAAADYLHAFDLSVRKCLDCAEHGSVAKCQRVEDYFRYHRDIARHFLIRFSKLRGDCLKHARWIEETRIIGKD